MNNVIDINRCDRLPTPADASASAARRARSRTADYGWDQLVAQLRPVVRPELGPGVSTGLWHDAPGERQWQARLKIGTHEIGDHTHCYVIAEIGHNHQGSLEKARELFREAKLAGAHAVKLQKRDNRGLYTRATYDKPYDNENSFGATYGEHRELLEFGVEEYGELQAYATELGIDFFATAFDIESADFLADARRAGLQDRLGRSEEHAAAASTSRGSASR